MEVRVFIYAADLTLVLVIITTQNIHIISSSSRWSTRSATTPSHVEAHIQHLKRFILMLWSKLTVLLLALEYALNFSSSLCSGWLLYFSCNSLYSTSHCNMRSTPSFPHLLVRMPWLIVMNEVRFRLLLLIIGWLLCCTLGPININ